MTSPSVPFTNLRPIEDAREVEAAIRRVIDSGWFVLGPEVERFEQEFAAASGAAHGVGVGTGTDALALCLKALGIGAGDEVITTPLSAAYTALAVLMVGARPVFADIDPLRHTLDPDATAAAVTPRTKAILPVHLYGQAADMRALEALARRHGLALLEDCCQAHLATCQGQPVGTFGSAAAFSFYPTKNLGALGDGGMATTNDAALADRIRRLRNGGQTDRYHHVEAGVNTRLDELQAAILRARLPRLRAWTDGRRALAAAYRQRLRASPLAILPEIDGGHVYHLFVVRTPERARFRDHLTASGIETLIHYPVPITRQPAMVEQAPASCPIAEAACNEVVSLPLYPSLDAASLEAVVDAVSSFPDRACAR